MLRTACEDDVESIRHWRNHRKVRAASFTTHEIGPAEHRAWWTATQADPARQVLIYERSGRPVGVVVLTGLGSPVVEWSKYLDVAGVGDQRSAAWADMEHEALWHVFETLGVRRLRGVTLAANRPVRELHARVGFTETGRFVREVDGAPVDVVCNEMTAEEWVARHG